MPKSKPPFTRQKTISYIASDGTRHDSLSDVKKAELSTLFKGEHSYDELLQLLVENSGAVVAILKVKERVRTKAKVPKKERKALGRGVEQTAEPSTN